MNHHLPYKTCHNWRLNPPFPDTPGVLLGDVGKGLDSLPGCGGFSRFFPQADHPQFGLKGWCQTVPVQPCCPRMERKCPRLDLILQSTSQALWVTGIRDSLYWLYIYIHNMYIYNNNDYIIMYIYINVHEYIIHSISYHVSSGSTMTRIFLAASWSDIWANWRSQVR